MTYTRGIAVSTGHLGVRRTRRSFLQTPQSTAQISDLCSCQCVDVLADSNSSHHVRALIGSSTCNTKAIIIVTIIFITLIFMFKFFIVTASSSCDDDDDQFDHNEDEKFGMPS